MLRPPEPRKRVIAGKIADSSRWDAFRPRAGDIVVNTPPKAGTTWTQSILALLISGDPMVDAQTSMKSPWIDITVRDIEEVMARLEAQDHRRQVKSHTPFSGIPVWPDLRYITVYRHPIDIHFSFVKHTANMKLEELVEAEPDDVSTGFGKFLAGDVPGFLSLSAIVEHYRDTLAREPRENFLRLHYADMKRDLRGAVERIAAHVGISHPPEVMAALTEAATFESMKAGADRFTPSAGQDVWRNDAGFFDSGTSNKWEGKLSDEELAAYDARIAGMLSPEERRWLEWGDGAG